MTFFECVELMSFSTSVYTQEYTDVADIKHRPEMLYKKMFLKIS